LKAIENNRGCDYAINRESNIAVGLDELSGTVVLPVIVKIIPRIDASPVRVPSQSLQDPSFEIEVGWGGLPKVSQGRLGIEFKSLDYRFIKTMAEFGVFLIEEAGASGDGFPPKTRKLADSHGSAAETAD
jgi:hypothetical protein